MQIVQLPPPDTVGGMTVEQALLHRRSVRTYTEDPLSLNQLSQILWSAQGITSPRGFRTAPSAGATFPMVVYAVVGNVEGLPCGVYRYLPQDHSIQMVIQGDLRVDLSKAALGQEWVENAPVVLVLSAIPSRTSRRYGGRAMRYIYIEAGHIGQNIYLQCASLGLGTVAVGAFIDEEVKDVLRLEGEEIPVYILPVGIIRR